MKCNLWRKTPGAVDPDDQYGQGLPNATAPAKLHFETEARNLLGFSLDFPFQVGLPTIRPEPVHLEPVEDEAPEVPPGEAR